MLKPLRKSAIEEMIEIGEISITIKEDWAGVMNSGGNWTALPATINYWIGTNVESIFTCYYSRDGATLQLTNIEPGKIIADKKALIDAYLYVAIKGIIGNAKSMRMKSLTIDSYIPAVMDHMLDLGFRVTPKGAFGAPGGRGSRTLEE